MAAHGRCAAGVCIPRRKRRVPREGHRLILARSRGIGPLCKFQVIRPNDHLDVGIVLAPEQNVRGQALPCRLQHQSLLPHVADGGEGKGDVIDDRLCFGRRAVRHHGHGGLDVRVHFAVIILKGGHAHRSHEGVHAGAGPFAVQRPAHVCPLRMAVFDLHCDLRRQLHVALLRAVGQLQSGHLQNADDDILRIGRDRQRSRHGQRAVVGIAVGDGHRAGRGVDGVHAGVLAVRPIQRPAHRRLDRTRRAVLRHVQRDGAGEPAHGVCLARAVVHGHVRDRLCAGDDLDRHIAPAGRATRAAAAGRGRRFRAALGPGLFHGQRAADGHTAHRHDQRDHQTGAGQRHSGVNAQLADRHAALDIKLRALRVLADLKRLHVRIQRHVGAAQKLHELRGDFDLNFLI